jgi:hypothetical protein
MAPHPCSGSLLHVDVRNLTKSFAKLKKRSVQQRMKQRLNILSFMGFFSAVYEPKKNVLNRFIILSDR